MTWLEDYVQESLHQGVISKRQAQFLRQLGTTIPGGRADIGNVNGLTLVQDVLLYVGLVTNADVQTAVDLLDQILTERPE